MEKYRYDSAKAIILRYLDDRKKYMGVYEDIKANINSFKIVTSPYEYVPKGLIAEFIRHLDEIIENHADVFDTRGLQKGDIHESDRNNSNCK